MFVAILFAVAVGAAWAQQSASFRFWSSLSPTRARELLPSRADVNKTDNDGGRTRLHWAAWNNDDEEVVRLLLERGADVHALDEHGQTPLQMAALENENVEVFRLLLEMGASLDVADTRFGSTPFHSAAFANDNVEVLRFLVDIVGAGILWVTDKRGAVPLHEAAGHNPNVEVVRFLLEYGSTPSDIRDKYGNTPLHFAARINENPKVLEVLLEHGASVDAKNNAGNTPLHEYARRDDAKLDSRDRVGLAETRQRVCSSLVEGRAHRSARRVAARAFGDA